MDYIIGSPRLLKVSSLQIGNRTPESDHKILSLTIKCNQEKIKPNHNNTETTNWTRTLKCKWEETDLEKFNHSLTDNDSIIYLNDVYDKILMLESVSDVSECFMKYLIFCVEKTCKLVPTKTPLNTNTKEWFDETCRHLRAIALNDPDDDAKFKTYKKYKQEAKRKFRSKNKNTLEKASTENPTEMWKILKE